MSWCRRAQRLQLAFRVLEPWLPPLEFAVGDHVGQRARAGGERLVQGRVGPATARSAWAGSWPGWN